MQRIPIINQEELFLDLNQEALVNGKVEILDPISNNPLDVWTYTDAEYTIATNPIRLSIEGRATQTIFSDRLSYIRVYKSLGIDEHNQEIFEFVRDYLVGFDENSESREYIIGMEALKDLDPSVNSAVNVIGYYELGDCETRQYVWDPNSQLDPDGGYVVASNVSATGRWILQFNGEYLPSSYYGVWPGKTANINALLSYVEVINGKKTAPGVWFVPGNYDVTTNLQTTKRVLLDAGTTFACDYFYCGNLKVIGEPQSAICDFDFYDHEQEAHSSWFKTVFGFLTSGAKKFILDAKDNFANKTLQGSVTLEQKIIEGQNRLPITYSGNGKINFSKCEFIANNIFNATDKVTFSYTAIEDKWWIDPTEIDFYGTVSARSTSLNKLLLANFENVTAYVNAIGADGQEVLDLAGRQTANLTLPNSVIEVRNAIVYNNTSIPANGRAITLKNCDFASASITANTLSIHKCKIHFATEPSVNAAWIYDSNISSEYAWTSKGNQYIFENCNVGVNFKRVTDNTSTEGVLSFTKCVLENDVIESKTLQMENNICNGCVIRVYPYKENDQYKMYCWFIGNIFNSGTPIEFTKVDMINGAYQDDVYEVIVSWTITGNHFIGNDEGLRCRYWNHRTGSNYNKTFIKINGYGENAITYKGNTGNCPSETASGISADTQSNDDWYWVELGNNQFQSLFKRESATKRLMPNLMHGGGPAYNSWLEPIDDSKRCIKWRWQDSDTLNIVRNPNIYPWSHLNDPVENGDLFLYGMSLFGKVTQSSPGRVETLEYL